MSFRIISSNCQLNFYLHLILYTCIVILHFLRLLMEVYNHFIKEVIFTIYERILAERNRLSEQISLLQTQLAGLPNGKLTHAHNGKHIKWFHSDGHQNTYIPKKNHTLIQQLATKKYLSLLAEDLSAEKNALDFYLRHHRTDTPKSQKLLLDTPEYRNLLIPCFTPQNTSLAEWVASPYIQNQNYPDN